MSMQTEEDATFEHLRGTIFRPRCGLCNVVLCSENYAQHFKSAAHLLHLIGRKGLMIDLNRGLDYKVKNRKALVHRL